MRRRVVLAAGILAVLALGACSHAGSNDQAGSSAGGGLAAAPARAAAPQDALDRASAHGAAIAGSSAQNRAASATGSRATLIDDGTSQIRTAQMTVAVRGAQNVAARADAAETIALGFGGEVDSDNRTSGPHATASLLLRVPPDSLEDSLTKLSALGAEKSRETSTTDVTQKVADVRSRVESAQASIEGFRQLLHRAKRISDIITLESELNSREADLESLQAQYRALSRETSMATITLSLVTAPKHHAPPPVKHHHKRGGFIGGLDRGWDGFTSAAGWLALAIGTLLPFIALLLVVGAGLRLLWPRLPRRHSPAPAPTE
jgi:hypothetical protein